MIGQEFKGHTDYFEPTGIDFAEHYRAYRGQRTWTAMAYLNTVDAGGATRFSASRQDPSSPNAGKLLIWCNLDRKGVVNVTRGRSTMR